MYRDGRWARSLEADDPANADAPFGAGFLRKAAAAGAATALDAGLELQRALTAPDGTHKLVFGVRGADGALGKGAVETVLIPMWNKDCSQPRYTVCVSTQVGCAMNCQFCFTGRMGLIGQLSAAQIVEQVVAARRWLAEWQAAQPAAAPPGGDGACDDEAAAAVATTAAAAAAAVAAAPAADAAPQRRPRGGGRRRRWPPAPARVNNVVFMGEGEALHNYGAVSAALDVLCDPRGLAFSKSKVIVSTVRRWEESASAGGGGGRGRRGRQRVATQKGR